MIELDINQNFFKPEIRNDFYVDEKRKKIWSIELDLINKLLYVCKKHNLKICMGYGTMLGAVRHGGFIPWDDDADVLMPRDDYNKLLELGSSEFTGQYFLQSDYSDTYFFNGFSRLRNSNTTGIISFYDSPNYNGGIFIDIFPLDGVHLDFFRYKIHRFQLFKTKFVLDSYYMHGNPMFKWLSPVSKMLHCIIPTIYSYKTLVDKYNYIISKYKASSPLVSDLTCTDGTIVRNMSFKMDEFIDCVWVPYEMISVPIPRCYDKILSSLYGDYMTFPPIEQRGEWHSDMIVFDPDTSYLDYYKNL